METVMNRRHAAPAAEQSPALITDTGSLAALCDRLKHEPFVTVDTEFMRERTYWPELCLVQLASPMS
jgi:ribonuclease D